MGAVITRRAQSGASTIPAIHFKRIAPDWSADWLHREAIAILDGWAKESGGQSYAALTDEEQSALRGRLEPRLRENTYDAASQTVTVDADRAAAIASVASHYESLFGDDASTAKSARSRASGWP